MPIKPRNHVTEALRSAAGRPQAKPLPDIDEELLDVLEKLYPPRCYDPRIESLESHLQYAGKVDLIATLRVSFEEQSSEIIDPADVEAED